MSRSFSSTDKSHKIPYPYLLFLSCNLKTTGMTALARLEKDFTENVMGYSALGIVLSTCLGSIAIFQILNFGHGLINMALVLLCVSICTMHNAAILTVQKPTMIFKLLMASTIINSLVILTSLFI